MTAIRRRLLWAAAATAAVPLLAALPVVPAEAATTRTVTVNSSGFSPNPQNAKTGDSIRYHNTANVQITITYEAKYPGGTSETVEAGATSPARKITKAGTYTVLAEDSLTSGGLFEVSGKIVVKAPKPSPTTASPAPKPSSASPKPPPRPTNSTTPPSATPAPTGAATSPPVLPGVSPTAGSPSPGNPIPSVAPPPDVPVNASGDNSALVQARPARRLGLPGALGGVLALGLIFGFARVLLAYEPPTREPRS